MFLLMVCAGLGLAQALAPEVAEGEARFAQGDPLGSVQVLEAYVATHPDDVEALWRPGPLPDRTGLHWYGGSPASSGAAATSIEGLARSVIREALCRNTSFASS